MTARPDHATHAELLQLAAANNADLCAAIFDAHGLRWHRDHGQFRAIDPPPELFPHLVTLCDAPDVATRALDDTLRHHPGFVAVKDSFAALNLEPLGFAPLFDAQWIFAEPAASTGRASDWDIVRTPAALARWEDAWAGAHPARQSFPDAILTDPRVVILGRKGGTGLDGGLDGGFDGGCILNHSPGAIGLSNVHGTPASGVFAAGLAAARALAPGMPVVGYESGAALQAALAAGFSAVGSLRVWCRD